MTAGWFIGVMLAVAMLLVARKHPLWAIGLLIAAMTALALSVNQ